MRDRSSIHDFHLSGPGLNRVLTSVPFTGTKSFVLRLRKGRCRFVCDPHARIMHGRFDVSCASTIARLEGRTISPDATLPEAFGAMTDSGRRRLAVTSDDSTLLGLLCLKVSGVDFCSDADVANRGWTRD